MRYFPDLLDTELKTKIHKTLGKEWSYGALDTNTSCGANGPQKLEALEHKENQGPGHCAIWTVWYLHMRRLYPNVQDLNRSAKRWFVKAVKNKWIPSVSYFIQGYARTMLSIGNEILKAVEPSSENRPNPLHGIDEKTTQEWNRYVDKHYDTMFQLLFPRQGLVKPVTSPERKSSPQQKPAKPKRSENKPKPKPKYEPISDSEGDDPIILDITPYIWIAPKKKSRWNRAPRLATHKPKLAKRKRA